MLNPPSSVPQPRPLDAARVIALALEVSSASSAERAGPPLDARDVDAARDVLGEWTTRVGAPPFEVRRVGRRIAVIVERLSPEALRAAFAESDPWAVGRLIVDECARHDRDFGWDVPLRDVARAIFAAAVAVA